MNLSYMGMHPTDEKDEWEDLLTSNKLFSSSVPDDVGPGPGVVHPAHELHLLLLANHQLLLCLVAHQLCLRWRHCKKHMSQPFLRPKVMLKQLTEHIQLCIGSNWLVSSIGADLALVDSFVLEGGVDDL